MEIPIMMTTFERPEYFKQSIESLKKSNADFSDFYIFDDCSVSKEKEKLWYSHFCKGNYCENKMNVGTVLNTIPNIGLLFNRHVVSNIVILLQDDILVSKSWLDKAIKISEDIMRSENKIAFLSLYNRINRKGSEKDYYVLGSGHPGFVACVFFREFWEEYRSIYDLNDYCMTIRYSEKSIIGENNMQRPHYIRNYVDYKMSHRIYDMGYKIAVCNESLVQHVGDKSTLGCADMSFCRATNFIGEDK